MKLIQRVKTYPPVAHWLRAFERFTSRLGNQFAAAITYFSVLSLVPILMFAFSLLGITLTVIRPDLLDIVHDQITSILPPGDLSGQVKTVIDRALQNWGTVGAIGLVTGMWSGANWAGNLKSAVRAQVREDFDAGEKKRMIVVETLINVGIMIALLLGLLLTFSISATATSLSGLVSELLDLDGAVSRVLLSLASVSASVLAGFLLFMFMMWVLPGKKLPVKTVVQGALIGSIGMAALQYLASLLIGVFSNNAAAALFGNVIVLMLFLNLFATLVLLVAAWIATARPVIAAPQIEVSAPEPLAGVDAVPEPVDPTLRRGFRIGSVLGSAAGAVVGALGATAAAAILAWRRPRDRRDSRRDGRA